MSLTDTTLVSKVILISTGALYPNSIFSYPFKILADTDLEVYDADTLVVITTDYTVTGIGDDNGGTVVFESGSEPAAAAEVLIRRIMTLDQQTDIPSAPAKFPEEAVEETLDKLTMIDQQQDEVAGRSLKWASTVNTGTVLSELPDPTTNAGKVLSFSTTGVAALEILASDIASPVSTEGDLLIYTTVPAALPVGTDDQALVVDTGVSGKLKWADMPATRGDILTRDATDNSILALGNPNEVVGSDGTDLVWQVMPWQQGQCKLTYTNSTTLTLIPYNGNSLVLWKTSPGHYIRVAIPDAGVTLANTGLTAATVYYIYASENFGIPTLIASTTAPVIEEGTGYPVKGASTTPTAPQVLVGAIYTAAGSPGTFADAATTRYTRSFFNDIGVVTSAAYSANRNAAGATYAVATTGTEITMYAMLWAGEVVNYSFSGSCSHSGAVACGIGVGINSATVITSGKTFTSNTANILDINHNAQYTVVTAGLHTFYSLSKTASGTLTFLGSATEGCFATAKSTGRK